MPKRPREENVTVLTKQGGFVGSPTFTAVTNADTKTFKLIINRSIAECYSPSLFPTAKVQAARLGFTTPSDKNETHFIITESDQDGLENKLANLNQGLIQLNKLSLITADVKQAIEECAKHFCKHELGYNLGSKRQKKSEQKDDSPNCCR